jgi:hypothetical protein
MTPKSLLPLIALLTILPGCALTSSSGHCRNVPAIPKVGTAGEVNASPLPDISGYRVRFHERDWQAGHVAVRPTPFSGSAVVVSASPFPALRVDPPTGPALVLPLMPVACA